MVPTRRTRNSGKLSEDERARKVVRLQKGKKIVLKPKKVNTLIILDLIKIVNVMTRYVYA